MKSQKQGSQLLSDYTSHINLWEVRMLGGAYGGRPYSKETVRTYVRIVTSFLTCSEAATIDEMESFIYNIPAESFACREKAHRALVSFCKHLEMDAGLMDQLAKLRPRRHIVPKRQVVTARDLHSLIDACKTINEAAILVVASETGLRVSEMANLKWADVNFDEGFIWIRQGKWMVEERRVGMTPNVRRHLMLLQRDKKPVFGLESRWGIYRAIKAIGERVGVEVTPHSLRRAFVTINHSKGRPLKVLQLMCGHKDLKTTESYCRTSELEAVEMMKTWA